jgi:hypothetical protein
VTTAFFELKTSLEIADEVDADTLDLELTPAGFLEVVCQDPDGHRVVLASSAPNSPAPRLTPAWLGLTEFDRDD